jgi:hypothetical protein
VCGGTYAEAQHRFDHSRLQLVGADLRLHFFGFLVHSAQVSQSVGFVLVVTRRRLRGRRFGRATRLLQPRNTGVSKQSHYKQTESKHTGASRPVVMRWYAAERTKKSCS